MERNKIAFEVSSVGARNGPALLSLRSAEIDEVEKRYTSVKNR